MAGKPTFLPLDTLSWLPNISPTSSGLTRVNVAIKGIAMVTPQ